MSSTFTDRERLDWIVKTGERIIFEGSGAISVAENADWKDSRVFQAKSFDLREAIDAAMLSAGLTPEPRETETELDAKRFAHYLVGNRAFRDNSIIKMEMRAVSGDDPTLDEWRAAIDKSILAAAKCKVLVD